MRRLAQPGVAVAALLALAALSGCGGTGGDKAGANAPAVHTLTFEVPDDSDPPAAVFATKVARLTNGEVRIRHDVASPYTSAVPANEVRLARALESGKVAVGYLPARAWAVLGVPDFKALLVPFALSTERASLAFARSPLADAVLQSLPHSVVGLALVPQEARRILAVKPPTTKADLAGLRIRIIDNPQTAADLRAVGARPVERLNAQEASGWLSDGKLDGVESNPASILNNGYQTAAHYFSTWSPFAKFQSIVVSRQAWDELTVRQQQQLRAAARDTVASAERSEPKIEREELIEICESNAVPALPNNSQLASIATAMRTTASRFVSNPGSKELVAQLLRLPGSGIHPLATPLPFRCTHRPKSTTVVHRPGATLPTGVYTVTISKRDWLKGGVINRDMRTAITYVTTFRKNGTWYQTQSPNYPDQGPFSGTYKVHGDQMTLVMRRAGVDGHAMIDPPETVHWSYFDGRLTLSNLIVADVGSRVLYAAHPWRRVS